MEDHFIVSSYFTYETSLASRAGPISDLVVNPVALKINVTLDDDRFSCTVYQIYPLPTPATYPNGAGTPRKCFLFRLASAAAVKLAISVDVSFVDFCKRFVNVNHLCQKQTIFIFDVAATAATNCSIWVGE